MCGQEDIIIIYSYVTIVRVKVRLLLSATPITNFIPELNAKWQKSLDEYRAFTNLNTHIVVIDFNYTWMFVRLPFDHSSPYSRYDFRVFVAKEPGFLINITLKYQYVIFIPSDNKLSCRFGDPYAATVW